MRGIRTLARLWLVALVAVSLRCGDSAHKLAELMADASPDVGEAGPGTVASGGGGGGLPGGTGGAIATGGLAGRGSGGSGQGLDAEVVCTSAPSGCCFRDQDCRAGFECAQVTCTAQTQTAGLCEYTVGLSAGQCWRDSDCPASSGGCGGPHICPCGFSCAVPDGPGTCQE